MRCRSILHFYYAPHTSAFLHREGCLSLRSQVVGKAIKLDVRLFGGWNGEYNTGSSPFFALTSGSYRVQSNVMCGRAGFFQACIHNVKHVRWYIHSHRKIEFLEGAGYTFAGRRRRALSLESRCVS